MSVPPPPAAPRVSLAASPRRRALGLALLALALLGNEWLLAAIFSPDRHFDSLALRVSIRATQLLLTATGLYALLRKPVALREDRNRALLVAASVLFALLLAEIATRLLLPAPLFHAELPYFAHRRLRLTLGPDAGDTVFHTTNEWGMRGPAVPADWADRPTFLTVGGSTTHEFYLPDSATWTARLGELLRADAPQAIVLNAGITGQSSPHHLLVVRHVLPALRPGAIIVLAGANDLGRSIYGRDGQLSPTAELLEQVRNTLLRSRLVQLGAVWYDVIVTQAPVIDTDYVRRTTELRPLERETPLPDSLPLVLPSLDDYRRNLRAIVREARAQSVSPILVTQPTLYTDGPPWDGVEERVFLQRGKQYVISAATFARLLAIFNDAMLEVCESERVDCVDLAAVMPHDPAFFWDGIHFKPAGSALVARLIHDHIIGSGFLCRMRRAEPAACSHE